MRREFLFAADDKEMPLFVFKFQICKLQQYMLLHYHFFLEIQFALLKLL